MYFGTRRHVLGAGRGGRSCWYPDCWEFCFLVLLLCYVAFTVLRSTSTAVQSFVIPAGWPWTPSVPGAAFPEGRELVGVL